MINFLTLLNKAFNLKSKDKSADVAIERLNKLLSQLPAIKKIDLEKFKKDLVYFLNIEYNIDQKDVLFSINDNQVTIQTIMPNIK